MATILIVDNRALNREFLVTLLGYGKHQLLEASNGAEALEIARKTQLDLVISDILMPIMDGHALALKMHADPVLSKIPIIFYTATYRLEEGRQLAGSCGVKYVLTKPCDPELILETVNKALGGTEEIAPPFITKNVRALRDISNRFVAMAEFTYNLIISREPERLLKIFCEGTCKFVGAKYGAVGVFPEGEKDTTLRYFIETGDKQLASQNSNEIAQVKKGRVMRKQNFIGVPLATSSHVYGFFYVGGKKEGTDFDEVETQLVTTFAEQVAILYENIEADGIIQRHAANWLIEKTAREKAEDASSAKSAFIAAISHELRTPLNAIIGYSEILEEESRDKKLESVNADAKKIMHSAQHLLYLINSVLDVSKIEAGRMEVYLEDANINTLVQDIEAIINPLLEKNHNRLKIKHEKSVSMMYTDIQRVRQALLNILTNANKFTKNGTISLDIKPIKKKAEALVQFTITDTGIGIPTDKLSKLFQRFSQVDASTTRKYGGTGLGLYLTKHFCQMLGGDISVESQEGKGSTFTVTLPQKSIVEADYTPGNMTEK